MINQQALVDANNPPEEVERKMSENNSKQNSLIDRYSHFGQKNNQYLNSSVLGKINDSQ